MVIAMDDLSKQTRTSPIDREMVLDRVGGDVELLQEIASIFLEEYPGLFAEIRAAVAAKNPRQLERAAHSLKGSVSNFGAEDATSAAYNLEKIGREGRMQDAPGAQDLLERELERLRPALLTLTA